MSVSGGCARTEEAAQLLATEQRVNAGTVTRGQVLRHNFQLQNVGRGPVKILAADGGCYGRVGVSKSTIGPSDMTAVEFSIQTGHLPEGPNEMSAILTTDEPTHKQMPLVLVFSVVSEFSVIPKSLDFGKHGGSVFQELGVVVGQPTNAPKVVDVRSTDESVSATVLNEKHNPNGVRLLLSIKSSASPGPHSGNIIVRTSSEYTPELRVPIRGRLISR